MPGIEGTGDPTMTELPKAMVIVLSASCPSAVASLGEVVYGGASKQRPGDKEGSGLRTHGKLGVCESHQWDTIFSADLSLTLSLVRTGWFLRNGAY